MLLMKQLEIHTKKKLSQSETEPCGMQHVSITLSVIMMSRKQLMIHQIVRQQNLVSIVSVLSYNKSK